MNRLDLRNCVTRGLLGLIVFFSMISNAEISVDFSNAKVIYMDENNKLKKMDENGNSPDLLSTNVSVSHIHVNAQGDVFIVFQERQSFANGIESLLARAISTNNVIYGIDSNLTQISWPSDRVHAGIQSDADGSLYYKAYGASGKEVLRKAVNGSATNIVNIINDNISIDRWLIRPDGELYMSGSTTSTGATWFRRLSTNSVLSAMASGISCYWLFEFPDDRIYAGLWDGNYRGVYRVPTHTGTINAYTQFIGGMNMNGASYTPEYSAYALSEGHDETYTSGFRGVWGSLIMSKTLDSEERLHVLAGVAGYPKTLVRYYPIPEVIELSQIKEPTLIQSIGNMLLVAGTKDGVNKLILYDPSTSNEVNLLRGNIEIYHLTSVGDRDIWMDGLDFNGNRYVVGRIPVAVTLTADGKRMKAGSFEEVAVLLSKPLDFMSLQEVVPEIVGRAFITMNPQSRTNKFGTLASFTVKATGEAPLYYQWQKNTVNIELAKSATYTIASVGFDDAGNYQCLVSNMVSAVTSAVATLTVNARKAAVNDYNGDGISELAVYDNNIGYWYAYSLQSGRSTVWQKSWGWPGAETVPGDYDGDGYSDLAVYDQATGNWYIWSMARDVCLLWARPWGWPGAETVSGDYNGDGISDLAVYDQPSGYWYIITMSDVVLAWERPWGWTGAITVPGDYDGDGINDLCVYDSLTGYWYVQTLEVSVLAWEQPWGWPGATTVPGDYDGDGKDDLAVYDQPSGNWYVWSLAKDQAIVWQLPWGWTGAVPVPGDYDGDESADLAVFDTIQGYWYIWSVAKNATLAWQQAWGWPGAYPPGGRE